MSTFDSVNGSLCCVRGWLYTVALRVSWQVQCEGQSVPGNLVLMWRTAKTNKQTNKFLIEWSQGNNVNFFNFSEKKNSCFLRTIISIRLLKPQVRPSRECCSKLGSCVSGAERQGFGLLCEFYCRRELCRRLRMSHSIQGISPQLKCTFHQYDLRVNESFFATETYYLK